ncbi:MAG: RluA family pseudouridine synthase [Spirochaetes bacterium]|nr:RluA family pseudouridine synthase [Spirochaetota bacterium]
MQSHITETMTRESTVTSFYNNMRVDKYLSSRFTYYSRNEWQRMIEEGRVKCNGRIVPSHKKLKTDDVVIYDSAGIDEPAVDTDYSIIYEDKNIIGINKSGNIPVHPSGKFFRNTLQSVIEKDTGMKIQPLHRLDRETSGAVLFAKDSATASAIQTNFSQVKKTYIALVHGDMKDPIIKITAPVGKNEGDLFIKKRQTVLTSGKKAVTVIKKLISTGSFSLIKAMPVTGRLHQIRVHCNHIGFPIVGDKLYGLNEIFFLRFINNELTDEDKSRLILPRCALHSRTVTFFHPAKKRHITVKASLPHDMKNFILDRIILKK